MSRELRIFLFALAGTVLLFAGVTGMLPEVWEVRRVALLPAGKEQVRQQFVDFENWKRWSPVARTGRSNTALRVEGEAGKPGHRLTWDAGPQRAVLEMDEVTDDSIRMSFRSRVSADAEMVEFGQGTVRWRDLANGTTEVEWVERMQTIGIMHKWFAWFGVQQKTQAAQIETSFALLRTEFEGK